MRGVTLSLGEGEMLGLVGESGSGKSVTGFAITRLLDAAGRITAGNIRFRGQDITKISGGDFRNLHGAAMAMIFQNPRAALNPIRAVGDQIADAITAHKRMSRDEARAEALELLRAVQIRDPEKRMAAYPHELSGGMCQRVMIAMAISCNPALLIADEPTTGLDVTTQKVVMDLLTGIAAERGMATILITHDLGLAARYCRRVVVMEQGRLVEEAEPKTLFHAPQHPYTRRLVAASPTASSRIADLVTEEERGRNVAMQGRAQTAACAGHAAAARGAETREAFRSGGGGGSGLFDDDQRRRERRSGRRIRFRQEHDIAHDLPVDRSERGGDRVRGTIDRPYPGTRLSPVAVSQGYPDRLSGSERQSQPALYRLRLHRPSAAAARWHARGRRAAAAGGGVRERVGLPVELLTRFPHQLSGGQKARVGIARAIACRPRLLVLDEPTAALDVSVQAVVLQLLDRLRREDDLAFLFVSHDLNVVRMMCDRTIVLQNGRIVEQGESRAMFDNPQTAYTRELVDAVPHIETGLAASAM